MSTRASWPDADDGEAALLQVVLDKALAFKAFHVAMPDPDAVLLKLEIALATNKALVAILADKVANTTANPTPDPARFRFVCKLLVDVQIALIEFVELAKATNERFAGLDRCFLELHDALSDFDIFTTSQERRDRLQRNSHTRTFLADRERERSEDLSRWTQFELNIAAAAHCSGARRSEVIAGEQLPTREAMERWGTTRMLFKIGSVGVAVQLLRETMSHVAHDINSNGPLRHYIHVFSAEITNCRSNWQATNEAPHRGLNGAAEPPTKEDWSTIVALCSDIGERAAVILQDIPATVSYSTGTFVKASSHISDGVDLLLRAQADTKARYAKQ